MSLFGSRRAMPPGRGLPSAGLFNLGVACQAFRLGTLNPMSCSWCGTRMLPFLAPYGGHGFFRCPTCDAAP